MDLVNLNPSLIYRINLIVNKKNPLFNKRRGDKRSDLYANILRNIRF